MPEKVLLPLAVSTRGCLEATTELDNVRRVVMVAAVGGAPVRVVKVLLPLAVSTRGCLEATTEVMCATTGQSRGGLCFLYFANVCYWHKADIGSEII